MFLEVELQAVAGLAYIRQFAGITGSFVYSIYVLYYFTSLMMHGQTQIKFI
jgi:hypothetical protein